MTINISGKLKNLSENNYFLFVLEQLVNYTTKVALVGTCDLQVTRLKNLGCV